MALVVCVLGVGCERPGAFDAFGAVRHVGCHAGALRVLVVVGALSAFWAHGIGVDVGPHYRYSLRLMHVRCV
jgi:hypothetical protein